MWRRQLHIALCTRKHMIALACTTLLRTRCATRDRDRIALRLVHSSFTLHHGTELRSRVPTPAIERSLDSPVVGGFRIRYRSPVEATCVVPGTRSRATRGGEVRAGGDQVPPRVVSARCGRSRDSTRLHCELRAGVDRLARPLPLSDRLDRRRAANSWRRRGSASRSRKGRSGETSFPRAERTADRRGRAGCDRDSRGPAGSDHQ